MVVLFYANSGLLEPTRADRLKWVFDAFTDLFDRVGLKTNIRKIVDMI